MKILRSLCFHGLAALVLGISLFAMTAAAEETAAESAEHSTPDQIEIETWVSQLDDDRYLVRERATNQLLEAGVAAFGSLLDAANSGRPEPADRAVWILRQIARSQDNDLAISALEHLIQVQGRPRLVEESENDLAERSIVACEQHLAPLGAEVSIQYEQVDIGNVVPLLQLRVGPEWQGTTDDLRRIAELEHQVYFRLQGAPVDDEAVKLFEEKQKLAFLQLRDTSVTPAAVDALKKRHPDATVYVRNQALLGISAENVADGDGVTVQHVQPGSAAAAAGIRPGDVIATIDGHELPDFDRLTVRIAQRNPGDKIDVEIIRGEERKKIAVTLGSWGNIR